MTDKPASPPAVIPSEDEIVDGPAAAARILNHMRGSDRQRLMKAITAANPEAARKITANLFTFEDIVNLTHQSVQRLIKEVEHRDLVLSLKLASDAVKQHLYQNMSERKRELVKEDLAALLPAPQSEAEEAQRRVIARIDELRSQGILRSGSDKDLWV